MRTRTERERSYRTAVIGGIVLSVAAHVAVLAYGSIAINSTIDRDRSVRLVQLAEVLEQDMPLEVVQIREPKDLTQRNGGSSPSFTADIPQLVTSPASSSAPATLSAAIPNPLAVLEVLEQEEAPENPVASYANLSDFAVNARSSPRPLRSMDDRPIEVLAALASVSNGSGVSMGGGHCPSQAVFF